MPRTYSLLTKTFKRDLAAFSELCETIDRHMPAATHYVMVDRSDLAIFRPFASENRHIIDGTAMLPKFHEFEILGKRLWLRFPRSLVRGWIYQQLAKIEFVARCEEDAIVLVDSDTLFLRPLTNDHVFDGPATRLFHNPGVNSGPASQSAAWHNVALESIGLPPTGYSGYDYISQAVIWSPTVVRAMTERIEHVSRGPWYDQLIRNFRFSEYVIYGVFCEQLPGPHQDLVSVTDKELSHCSWHYDLDTPEGIDIFVKSMRPDQVAVLIQSNLQLDESVRRAIIDRLSTEIAGQSNGTAERSIEQGECR